MAIEYRVYFRLSGDNWTYQGTTLDTEWYVDDLGLDYFSVYEWRVDTHDTETGETTTGDTWTFISQHRFGFSVDRRSDYNEDYVWDIDTGTWVSSSSIAVTGGGRYVSRLVAIGHDAIYFGDI